MSWRYGVIRDANGNLGVHEIYYNDSGKIWGLSEKPLLNGYDSVADILQDLSMIKEDVENYQVIDGTTLVFDEPDFVHAL